MDSMFTAHDEGIEPPADMVLDIDWSDCWIQCSLHIRKCVSFRDGPFEACYLSQTATVTHKYVHHQ